MAKTLVKTKRERVLLGRVNEAMEEWITGKGCDWVRMMKETKLTHPRLMRLRKGKENDDSPRLSTVVAVLAVMGKKLKIVNVNTKV